MAKIPLQSGTLSFPQVGKLCIGNIIVLSIIGGQDLHIPEGWIALVECLAVPYEGQGWLHYYSRPVQSHQLICQWWSERPLTRAKRPVMEENL